MYFLETKLIKKAQVFKTKQVTKVPNKSVNFFLIYL